MGKKGYIYNTVGGKIMAIMRAGEKELLSDVSSRSRYGEKSYKNIKYILTNWRIIGEGETHGGLFSSSETKTLFEIPLNSVTNVSAMKGGFFKGSDRVSVEVQVMTSVTSSGERFIPASESSFSKVARTSETTEKLKIEKIELIVKDINRWADEIKKAVAAL